MPTNPFSMASPYSTQQMEIARRQNLAQMLQKQSMEPIEAPQGGAFAAPISPLQVAAKIYGGYQAGQIGKQAEEKQKALAEQMQTERQQALARALQQAQGSPQPAPELGGGPAMPPDQMGAAQTLAGSQDPMLAQAGMRMIGQQFQNMMPPKPQPFTLAPGAVRYGPDGKQIASAPEKPPAALSNLGKLIRERNALPPNSPMIVSYDQAIKQEQLGAQGRPYYQFLPTAEGVVAGNARTGQLSKPTLGGQSVVTAPADPALQGRIKERGQVGTEMGKYVGDVQADAAKAAVANRYLDNMDAAAKDFQPGKLAPMQSSLVQWAQAAGIPVSEADKQAAGSIQALTSMAIKMAGTATRQADAQPSQLQYFKILESMPNEARTPEGFRSIMAYLRDTNNYNVIKHEQLTQWRSQHNGSAEGFEAQWPEQAKKLPLVWNQQRRATDRQTGGLSAQEQQELNALRKRFGR